MPRYQTRKPKTDPTYSAQWSGVTYAPRCRFGRCATCNYPLHHEGGAHYCPGCDDYKPRPQGCTYD